MKYGPIKIIMEALEKNRTVQAIKFMDIVIHEREASTISELLKVNSSIQKLEIVNCGLDDASMIQISQGVGLAKQLKHLDLRHNHFEAQGLHTLTNAL